MTNCWRWKGPLKAIFTVCLQGTGMGQAQSGPCTGPYSAVLPVPAPSAFAQALPHLGVLLLSLAPGAPHETRLFLVVFPSPRLSTALLPKAGSAKWELWTLEGRSVVGHPVHCRVWSGISGLHPADACNNPSPQCDNLHSLRQHHGPYREMSPGENP